MTNSHTTDTEAKTTVPDSGMGAVMGEDEYIVASSSGDISKMASGDSPPLKPQNVLQLQRKLGNKATMNIIARQFTTSKKANQSALPFAGLKMVSPTTIQRAGGDNPVSEESPLEIDDADEKDDQAIELDASDKEVQEDSKEIDQTISEASQLPAMLNGQKVDQKDDVQGIVRSDTMDSDMDEDENGNNIDFTGQDENTKQATTGVGVSLGLNDDPYGDSDQDTDDENNGMNLNYSKVVSNQIVGQKGHKQMKGVNPKGHHLAAETVALGIRQGIVDGSRNATTGLQIAEATKAITSAKSLNDALTGIADTSTDVGSDGIQGVFSKVLGAFEVPPLNVILPVAMLASRIYGVFMKYKHMTAFKKMMKSNNGNVKDAKKKDTSLQDKGAVGAYGFAKTKRGFWLRVAKAAISVGQVIARLITLLTGGMAGLVSEAVVVSTSLSQGVIKVGQSLKGIYKMIRGTRGKRRVESANYIVDGAIDGDKELLQFMIDGEVLSKWFMDTNARKYQIAQEDGESQDKLDKLLIMASRPKTTDEMKTYLETAEELEMLQAVKGQVSMMTKST